MAKTKKTETNTTVKHEFIFRKENYMLMLIGVGVIVLGFILMYGKEDIYDFRKTTLAPIVVIAGFVIEIVAIMKKPKGE